MRTAKLEMYRLCWDNTLNFLKTEVIKNPKKFKDVDKMCTKID